MAIRVTLYDPSDRRFIQARWTDPITGKLKTKSTSTTIRREAERFAARLEQQLNDADFREPVRVTWAEFRQRYETEIGPTKAPKTLAKTRSMFKAVEDLIDPKFLSAMTSAVISTYAAKLRARGVATWTVRGHLAELRKTLRWAYRIGLLAQVPSIELPRATTHMKGRPITGEEFDRFLAAIPEHVKNPEWVPGWQHLCEGLWLSGLRREEAMVLHWTDDTQIMVDLSGRYPMLRIPADKQKSRQFELLPITPDFAEFLLRTPTEERTGWVFRPWTPHRGTKQGRHRPAAEHVGKVLSRIGKTAGIKVNDTKFASAHDFRRSFANRWTMRVPSQLLCVMMRHASEATTRKFYKGETAQQAAEHLWQATGNTFGNSQPVHGSTEIPECPKTSANHGVSKYPREDSNL